MKYIVISLLYMILSVHVLSKDRFLISEQSVHKDFLIVKSTQNYEEAISYAEKISTLIGIKLDLRALQFNKEIGLSETKNSCEESAFSYPCYVARGRYDDGTYVSVEFSNAYQGFSKGYYIVVVSSGIVEKSLLERVREVVPDAYVKKTSVYMGCMH